jgi:glycosyltransferase involved in cell wall biosynthesis
MAIFSLRSAASFRNQSALLYRAAVQRGWEVEERDISERATWPQDRWDRILVLGPLWPRYCFDSVRLAAPWLSQTFWLYGPVDGPYTMNIGFFQVLKNAIGEDRVAVPSQFCAEMMGQADIHVGAVVPHGLDPKDFEFDPVQRYDRLNKLRASWPGRTLFFSNLNPIHRKGFFHLARALEILSERRPNDWVFILHTGREKALQLAPELAKVPNLVVEDAYNQLPFRQVALKTLSCDVFVFPSLLEGFGLPVLEAMMAKRCIVMADARAHNELVDHKSAWLVPIQGVKPERWEAPGCMAQLHEYDPADLAAAMEHAMDHPAESQEKAEHAYERAQAYHYLRVYEPFVRR